MRWKIFLIFLVGIAFFTTVISASYTISDSYVKTDYQQGEIVSGWVEISFENQSLDSTITDTFGNSILLSDWLDANSDYNFSLDSGAINVSSDSQKIYLGNLSFYLPVGNIPSTKYQINISNENLIETNITINNAGELIKEMLSEKNVSLTNFITSVSYYPTAIQNAVEEFVDTAGIRRNLTDISNLYNSSSEKDYEEILTELEKIKVPNSIYYSESAESISFVSDKDAIDLDFLSEIGGGSYDINNENAYKEAIIYWNQQNLNPKITFMEINVNYEDSTDSFDYVKISVNSKPSEPVYLVLYGIDSVSFEGSYGEKEYGNYIYLDLSEAGKSIEFITQDSLDLANIPLFISPSLNSISIDTTENIIDSDTESKVSKWVLMTLLAVFLIIVFIICYIVLKTWYDKKYENYLFKNKNSLYNLVVYIHNAKRKGITNGEIEKSLRTAKWSNEQIRYIMRKYAGKRTGMWAPFSKDIRKKIKDTKFNNPKQ